MQLRSVILSIFTALLMLSCTGGGRSDARQGHTLRIATTIAPVASLVKQIAGDSVAVHILLPQGNTPESYEPTPQDLYALSQCDVYFYVGDLGFEKVWINRIAELYPQLKLIRLDKGIETVAGALCADGHLHDPHYWMSFGGTNVMARNIAQALSELSPTDSARYTTACKAIEKENERLAQRNRPFASAAFVIYHPSLTYYAEEMSLRQLVIEHHGKEPSARQLKQLIQEAQTAGVQAVFVQQEFNPALTETIAQELRATTYTINPLSEDYRAQLVYIDSVLRQ